MDNDVKNQTIFLTVIGVATLLVAIVGATFAWFSVSVSGNAETEPIVYTTASLGAVVFNDGYAIDAKNIMPGDIRTKTFTVSQTDPSATSKIKYNIILNVTENTLSPVSNNLFVNSLTGTGNTNGGTLASLSESLVPTTSTVIGSGELNGYEVHTYTYSLSLKNINVPQNEAQGKIFNGYITVELEQLND